MNNLTLQVTPIEVSYQTKDSVTLSCLFKKVAISTGHLLEKHEIKSSSELISGKVNFVDGPTFSLSKEFQLKNTKISLHFLAKKDRNISCIGSAEVDVANLPNQPYSMIELKLTNCTDPKAKLKLEIQRKEQCVKFKKQAKNVEKMGILETESVQRQQYLLNRRANHNIPTAYEISRRNYKHVQLSRQDKSQSRKHGSNSNVSYQQRHHIINKDSKTKQKNESPMPRKKTPQPIIIDRRAEQVNKNKAANSKYSISNKSNIPYQIGLKNDKRVLNNNNQQAIQQPERLEIEPYQQNNENISNNFGYKQLQQQKNSKYKKITQKLQLIHDKIITGKDKNYTVYSQQINQNIIENNEVNNSHEIQNLSYFKMDEDSKSLSSHLNQFDPQSEYNNSRVADSFKLETHKILQDSSLSSQDDKRQKNMKTVEESDNKFINIRSVKTQSPQTSPQSQKQSNVIYQIFKPNEHLQKQLQSQIERLQKHNKQLISQTDMQLAQIQLYKSEIKQLKSDLSSNLKKLSEKDKQIIQINKSLQQSKCILNQKQQLLIKINDEYQSKFQEVQILKSKLELLEQSNQRRKDSQKRQSTQIKTSTNPDIKPNEDEIRYKKQNLELEMRLRQRENQIKKLALDVDNLNREKAALQQEIGIIAGNNKNQMTRQRSIAHIQTISNNSLAQYTKRENQALKTEVKLLQEKLQSLNALFQTLVAPNSVIEKGKITVEKNVGDIAKMKYEQRIVVLEQKCSIFQKQLQNKKNLMAKIINLIWKFGDSQLMDNIDNLMSQS